MQLQLFNKGLVHSYWRPGTGMLNAALKEAKNEEDIEMIHKAKTVFRISMMAFIPFILLAIWQMCR